MPDSTALDNDKLSIRNAYPQDAPAIAAMLVSLCEYEGTQTPFSALEYAKVMQQLIAQKDASYFFIMADYDGKPAGFISYYFGYDLSSLSQGAHIGDLFLREEYRNLSIGTKLLAKVGEHVLHKSGQWIALTALRSNQKARDFYEKRFGVNVPVEFYAWGQDGIGRLIKQAEKK